MPTSALAPEQLAFVVLAALPLTLGASAVLLWMYRRALQKAMLAKSDAHSASADQVLEIETGPFGVTQAIRFISVAEARRSNPHSTLEATVNSKWRRSAFAYTVAGIGQAMVAVGVSFLISKIAFRPLRVVSLTWVYTWPVILTWNILRGPDWKARSRDAALYFAGLGVLSVVGIVNMDAPHRLGQGALLWALLMLTPTVLVYFALARSIRAVGPMVLIFMVIGMFGANEAVNAVEIAFVHKPLNFSDSRFWAIFVAGFAVLGLCGGFALSYFRRRYERKRTSDMALTLDCMWLLFALFACMMETDAKGLLRLTPLVAFAAYKTIASYLLRPLYRDAAGSSSRRLLLLRAFGHRGRTRRMLDLLGARWRYLGSIQLVAAPDLAADYVGIPQFLDYMRRRLEGYFIRSEEDLERRMDSLDTRPDPDGRFRVNMFFCFENTWKVTVARLIRESEAILMDLRGFTQANRGCAEELRAVFGQKVQGAVLLLIDKSTDISQLQIALRNAGSRSEVRILRAAGVTGTVAATIAMLDPASQSFAAVSSG